MHTKYEGFVWIIKMKSFSWGSKTDANSGTDGWWRRPWAKKFIDRQNFSSAGWYKKVDTFYSQYVSTFCMTEKWYINFCSGIFLLKICTCPQFLKEQLPQILHWQTTFSSLGHVVSNMSTLYLLVNEKKSNCRFKNAS